MKVLDSSGLWYMTELLRSNFNNINNKIIQGDNNVLNYVNGSFKSGLLTTDDASVYLKKNGDTANTLTINSTFVIGGTVGLNGGYGISSYFAPRPLTTDASTLLRRTLTFDVSTYKPWVMGPINNSTGFVIGQAVGHYDRYGPAAAVHPYFKIDASGNIYEHNESLKDKYALKTDISTAIADLVNSAPETLNTLDELATALGDDPNFATTVATELGKKANSSDLNNYLPLSGGTMTGPISGLTSLTSAGNITATEYGFRLSSTEYDGYIWNTVTGKAIAIGVIDNGSTTSANASLVIRGTNIYPGTSNKFSLGTDSYKFKDIFADGRVVGGRFLTETKTKAVLESNTNTGLSIVSQIPLSGTEAGDYGFNTTNNANGVLAFRTHAGSGANYMHYLGFSNDGEIYHTAQNAPFAGWRNLTNPFGSIRMPRTVDRFHSQAVIPSMLNEGIVNIFNYPLKSELLIERSQDGSTWVDVTEDEYENFRRGFTKGYNQGSGRYVAYDKTNGKVGDRLRITYNPSDRYCAMGYIDVYYTTSGATTTFTLEHNTKADINTWTKIHDSKSCTGWPGHNYYGLLGYNFGQTNVTTGAYAYRMTFEITAISSSNNNLGAINYIYGFTAQTPFSSRSDSYFRYDVTLQACRNTGHIIPSSTGYELGNQQFPFKTVITQNLAISLGSGHTPNYITSDNNRNMFIKIADVIPFVVDCADTNNPIVRSASSMAGKVNLGTSTNKWNNVYANNVYVNNFYGRLHTPDGTSAHFVKGDGTISTQVNVTHDATSASPLNQAICINAAAGTDDIAKMPGIGFHNPGKSYATLKYTGTFEFMNETLTSYKNVKAAKFITTGGTASQVVLGDGTLKAISDFTDTKVTQTERDSSNNTYPILLSETSSTGTRGVIFGSTPRINPATFKLLGIDYIQSDSSDIELIADEHIVINGTHLWPKTVNSIDIGGTNNRFKDAYFSGTVYAATSFMQSSDERLKDFGPELEVNLDELSKLRKSYFTFKDKPEDLQIGVSAQEIQKLYPEIVSETDDGYLNVDYSKLAIIALAAIDKLNEEIKELKKLINK